MKINFIKISKTIKTNFYCTILLLSGYLFSSDNSMIQTHTVAGVPVRFVQRLEVEPDENGVQEALEILNNDENRQNDLRGAQLVTVEIDYQAGEAYINIEYPNGDGLIDRLY